MDGGAWWAAVHGVAGSRTRLSDFTFTFHFHALEKEMVTHSSVLAWRIPGMGEPGGLPSMGSHRVGYDWSNLAAAAQFLESYGRAFISGSLHHYSCSNHIQCSKPYSDSTRHKILLRNLPELHSESKLSWEQGERTQCSSCSSKAWKSMARREITGGRCDRRVPVLGTRIWLPFTSHWLPGRWEPRGSHDHLSGIPVPGVRCSDVGHSNCHGCSCWPSALGGLFQVSTSIPCPTGIASRNALNYSRTKRPWQPPFLGGQPSANLATVR